MGQPPTRYELVPIQGPAERNESVHELLYLARRAWDESEGARDDGRERDRLTARAVLMRRDADTIDPGHECAAWADHLRGTN